MLMHDLRQRTNQQTLRYLLPAHRESEIEFQRLLVRAAERGRVAATLDLLVFLCRATRLGVCRTKR